MTLDRFKSHPGVDLELDPELAERLEGALAELEAGGLRQLVLSGRRDTTKQAALFTRSYTTKQLHGQPSKRWQGKTWWRLPGMPEVAVPGTSRHERGAAVDLDLPASGFQRLIRLGIIGPVLERWGLTNRRVHGEPWHVEVRDNPPPLPSPHARRNRTMHELVWDIDRDSWFLSGPAGLERILNPDTLALYRDGLSINATRITEPLPTVVHKSAVFDVVCGPRVLPGTI